VCAHLWVDALPSIGFLVTPYRALAQTLRSACGWRRLGPHWVGVGSRRTRLHQGHRWVLAWHVAGCHRRRRALARAPNDPMAKVRIELDMLRDFVFRGCVAPFYRAGEAFKRGDAREAHQSAATLHCFSFWKRKRQMHVVPSVSRHR
jgi:hypothetical protein